LLDAPSTESATETLETSSFCLFQEIATEEQLKPILEFAAQCLLTNNRYITDHQNGVEMQFSWGFRRTSLWLKDTEELNMG
jgi:hypothetical protein